MNLNPNTIMTSKPRLLVVLCAVLFCVGGATWAADQTVVKLNFSAQPTDAELFAARVLDEPLVPLDGEVRMNENQALAAALMAYANRTIPDDCSSLSAFAEAYPDSRWTGPLLLHLGAEYYNYGYYSKALDAWERAWALCRDVRSGPAKPEADRALGELARMYSKLGRMTELSQLLNSTTNRDLAGPGTQLIHAAQEALWMMQNRPGYCFRCGPLALDRILLRTDPKKMANPAFDDYMSPTNGFTLTQVATLTDRLGMNYQMAFRSLGASFVVPAVIHWKVGHYAAVVEQRGDRFLVQDFTFQGSVWMTTNALEEEASGYFLIPPGTLPAGWRTVSSSEGQSVSGKGYTSGKDNRGTGNADHKVADCKGPAHGMATYSMNTMLASLTLTDTPVGHDTPIGPAVLFTAQYRELEASQPATFYYSNLGPKWTCNWITYITDNPTSPDADVSLYVDGGGTYGYTDFNPANGTYMLEPMSLTLLRKTASASYELQYSDGSRREYTMSDGSTGSTRRIFLTQMIDPSGHTTQFQYDSQLRITNVVDTIGQGTTLLYTNTAYPYAITAVIDPFGRTAYLQYNSSGLLVQITDAMGLTSQFNYGTNEFINALITPYGTSTFATATTNGVTYLQATDPDGQSELLVSSQSSGIAPSLPASEVPHGLSTFNLFLDARDSFYWDKRAYEEGAWDYSKAHIYHWLHLSPQGADSSRILESEKAPLESRVWYNYSGQYTNLGSPYYLDGAYTGSNAAPTVIARVLDDGTTQLSSYAYNSMGNITNATDPVGRNFTFIYDSNNVDLLEVRMTHNGKNELLTKSTYNAQHQPLTVTDASGHTTTFTYNSLGLMATETAANNDVTTYSYDTNGYLLSVQGPLAGTNDSVSFTYDAWGRLLTLTDTSGYTITYTRDAFDRITQLTFPDGTSEQYVYNRLDLVAVRDRLGRWSTNTYDAVGQLLSMTDPLGQTTRLEWCKCGALSALTDPLGRTTSWDYDVQGRAIQRQYPDGSTIVYNYENNTSRLHSRQDEAGQLTVLEYNADDTIKRISFPNAVIPTPTVSYTYDPDYARLLTIQDGVGSTVLNYNPVTSPPSSAAGEVASISGPLPNSLVAYQYDDVNRITNRSIAGVNYEITFDALDRPVSASNPLGVFHYSYSDASARLASVSYPNGQTTLYSYYDTLGDNLLKSITNLKPGGGLLSAFSYAHNALLITAQTNQWDSLPTRVWQYSYDAANQLTNAILSDGVSPITTLDYAYDAAGNRILVSSNGVQTASTFNSLNQLGSGQSQSASAQTFEWDAEKRLTAINQGTHRSEFTYDAQGHRDRIVEKDNGIVSSDNYFVWADSTLCEVRDATGATALRRLFVQGESVNNGGSISNYYYTSDHLGSIRELSDAGGNLVTRYDYDPFGLRTVVEQGVPATLGFGGHYIHAPSGYNLALFRAMDNANGRWLSRDPMGEDVSLNLYEFMGDDPVNISDPLGLWFGWDDAAAIALGALTGVAFQAVSDIVQGKSWEEINWGDYVGAAVGGAAAAELGLYLGPGAAAVFKAGAIAGAVGNVAKQASSIYVFKQKCEWSLGSFAQDTVIGGVAPVLFNGGAVKSLLSGSRSGSALDKAATFLANGAENAKITSYIGRQNPAPNLKIAEFLAANQTPLAAGQMALGTAFDSGLVQSGLASALGGSGADNVRELVVPPCDCKQQH
jgi:RHS repeat-associated protein